MTDLVETRVEGRLGIVTLNRPQAINALSGEMIHAAHAALRDWLGDDRVAAVLLEGKGERGFCAGGDVRAVRQMVLDGDAERAVLYFHEEYCLDGLIATYPKPVVAIAHGATMGGGIGLAGHARYRLALPDTRFAMPEAAIGFVVDVGANAILAQTLEARALLFLMAGLPAGPADALALGLCDAAIDPARWDALRAQLIVAASSAHADAAIVGLMQAHGIDAGEAVLCGLADRHAGCFVASSAGEIVSAVRAASQGDASLEPYAKALANRSPTSLEAILQSHRQARKNAVIGQVLANDLALAGFMIGRHDFAEGVRAVLVDKDFSPRWNPAAFTAVPRGEIVALLAGVSAISTKSFADRLG